ncbi:hypothetical protein FRC01_006151 [Tulasnella sp. 417]|nr:hypothetical protein FRC01_006151 [Tulasnella sp. 417]
MGDQKNRLKRLTRSARAELRQNPEEAAAPVDESQMPTETTPSVPIPGSNDIATATHGHASAGTNAGQVKNPKKCGAARPKAAKAIVAPKTTKATAAPKATRPSAAPQKPVEANGVARQLERDEAVGAAKNLVEGVNSILDQLAVSGEEDEESDFVDEEEQGDDETQEDRAPESSGPRENSIVIEYEVPAGNRTRTTNVPSDFPFAEHQRAIAATMGYTERTQVKSLELAWKLSTAKKSDLPAELASEKDLKKMTSAYRTAVEKEAKKHTTYWEKVKKGTIKPGTKEPVQADIVVVISDTGAADKKSGKGKEGSTDPDLAPPATKPDTTFYKRLRAAYPCATDPRAICFLTAAGQHIHATPNDVDTWEALEKQNPERYSIESGQIPAELKLYDALGRRPARAAMASGPPPLSSQTQAQMGSSNPQLHPAGGFGILPSSQASALAGFDPNLILAAAAFNPFARMALGYPNAGYPSTGSFPSLFEAPPSPAKAEISVDYPLITDWLGDAVNGNPKRVRDGQSYLVFGEKLTEAGFFRIDELVNRKHVTVEALKTLGIEVGYANNILSWAEADVTKIQQEARRAKRTGF